MKKASTKAPTLREAAAETAARLADLLSDPRTLTAIRDAIRAEVLDFADRYGNITAPGVLLAAYPVLCERARFNPLAPFVASLNSTPSAAEYENADALKFPAGAARKAGVRMPDDSLAHLGIFAGDWLTYESAAEVVRRGGSIDSGDLVAITVGAGVDEDPPEFVGELRVEGDKVHLVTLDPSHPTHTFRARDVTLLGRVSQVTRYISGAASRGRGGEP
jgi:hypothetical protein